MSIAVGFRNHDWIVLCADRQMTDANAGLKFEDSKIWWLESPDGKMPHIPDSPLPYRIGFAYCGNPDQAKVLARNATDSLYEAVSEATECDLVHGPEYFREALRPIFKSKDARGIAAHAASCGTLLHAFIKPSLNQRPLEPHKLSAALQRRQWSLVAMAHQFPDG